MGARFVQLAPLLNRPQRYKCSATISQQKEISWLPMKFSWMGWRAGPFSPLRRRPGPGSSWPGGGVRCNGNPSCR